MTWLWKCLACVVAFAYRAIIRVLVRLCRVYSRSVPMLHPFISALPAQHVRMGKTGNKHIVQRRANRVFGAFLAVYR